MAYINYGQNTTGGKQLAELTADIQSIAARLVTMKAWIGQIGVGNLAVNTDFSVLSAQAQAFNDTVVGVADGFAVFYGDPNNDATIAGMIARLARGS